MSHRPRHHVNTDGREQAKADLLYRLLHNAAQRRTECQIPNALGGWVEPKSLPG